MIKKWLCLFSALIACLLSSTLLGGVIHEIKQSKRISTRPVVCITIPKSGTHLLVKCLSLLGDPLIHLAYEKLKILEANVEQVRTWNKRPPPNHFKGRLHVESVGPIPRSLVYEMQVSKKCLFYKHFPYTQAYNNFLDKKNAIKFLMIRDPRAMIVSFAHMIHKGFKAGQVADIEHIILDLIDGRQKYYVPWAVEIQEAYPPLWESGVVAYYNTFLPFLGTRNCKLIKFEDLVGEQGGGSLALQLKTIKEIANHVGMKLNEDKIIKLSDELFGGSGTFREGKIDGWKKHFTPKIKNAFKKTPGTCELLISLGYEKDSSW